MLPLFLMSSAPPTPTTTRTSAPRTAPLPVAGVLRLGRPSGIWFKPAVSVVAATAPPNLLLVALGRLDLAMYTMAGSLCALYAHDRPYAARARTLAGVVAGMVGGLGVALTAASLTTDPVLLVIVGAVLAAVQKLFCDAVRIGPPGHVILAFVSSAALFLPQTLDQVPLHLAWATAAGAWAWLVGMAPAPFRPHGPERRATAHALRAAAGYAEAGPEDAGARASAHAAVQAARRTLRWTGARSAASRRALELLVVRAEIALAAPADTDPGRLRTWAHALRGTGPVPHPDDLVEPAEVLLGTAGERTGPSRDPWTRLAPSSRSPRAPRSAAPWPVSPPAPSASADPTGPWSPRPRSTRPTSCSPGTGRCSASSAISSACCCSPPSPPSPT